jgi:hypothetical protein
MGDSSELGDAAALCAFIQAKVEEYQAIQFICDKKHITSQ